MSYAERTKRLRYALRDLEAASCRVPEATDKITISFDRIELDVSDTTRRMLLEEVQGRTQASVNAAWAEVLAAAKELSNG